MPFGNEVYLSKFLRLRPFRIHMAMEVYFQNPRNGGFLKHAPSGWRCPLEKRYTFPSSLGHGLSEYIWLWLPISKILEVVAFLFMRLQEGDALWK